MIKEIKYIGSSVFRIGALLFLIFLIGIFQVEAKGMDNYYPYIINPLPIKGYVKSLIIPPKTPNVLFALVGYDGKPKPSDKAGLYIFDISEVTRIKQISYWPIKSPIGMELSPSGQMLFLYANKGDSSKDWYGVLALDISNPHAVQQAGRIDIDISRARLSVNGSLLFIEEIVHGKKSTYFFDIYRISPVNRPTLLARVEWKWFDNFFPNPDGRSLILNNLGEFYVFDIANPSAPKLKNKFSPRLGYPQQIGKDGTLYILDGDDFVLATSTPNITKIGTLRGGFSGGDIQYITDNNKTAYITRFDKTIHVIDMTIKTDPKVVAQYTTPNYIGSAIPANDHKLIYAGLVGSIVVIDPAKAIATSESLIKAHAEALRQYHRKDDEYDFERSWNAINVLEAAGIKSAIKSKPSGLSDKIFANILNDYGFFLERKSRRDEAVEIFKMATKLDPARTVAYLNLGDCLRKQLSVVDTFQKKIILSKEIKRAYSQYKKLQGISTPSIDSFLALNIIDKPIANFCEYVAAYTNQGRFCELLGSGRSVKKHNGVGSMRVEISYEGTAHYPYVQFIDNQTNKEIDENIPDNGNDAPWASVIDIVPFLDGHHLLYHNGDGYLVISAPIGFSAKTSKGCRFDIHHTESFDENKMDLCHIIQTSKHPSFFRFSKSNYLDEETLKNARYNPNWTNESGAAEVDFDNDGKTETLIHLHYQSGAGPGCTYDFFDLLNEEKDGFSSSKRRALLLKMQGIEPEARGLHPVPHCYGNIAGWFRYHGITYFETKYPEGQPLNNDQEFHTVSYIKNGQIIRACDAKFKIKVETHRGNK